MHSTLESLTNLPPIQLGEFEENFRQQIASVIDIIAARKMRVSVAETSRLALHSSLDENSLSLPRAFPGPNSTLESDTKDSMVSKNFISPIPDQPSAKDTSFTSSGEKRPSMDDSSSGEVMDRFAQSLTLSAGTMLSKMYGSQSSLTKFNTSEETPARDSEAISSISSSPSEDSPLTTHSASELKSLHSNDNSASGSGIMSRYIAAVTESPVNKTTESSALVASASSDTSLTSSSSSPSSSSTALKGIIIPTTSASTSVVTPPSTNPRYMNGVLPEDRQEPSSRLGILNRSRQFGAWIIRATTAGEKVDVSNKDLNYIVPNSF